MGPTLKIRPDSIFKFHQPKAYTRLYRSERSRRFLGNLLMREAFEVGQLEGEPLLGRQLGNRRPAQRLPLARRRVRLDVAGIGLVRNSIHSGQARPRGRTPGAQAVDRAASSRHEEPGENAPSRGVESRRGAPHEEEDLLKNLFRLPRVSEDPGSEAQEPGRVQVVE